MPATTPSPSPSPSSSSSTTNPNPKNPNSETKGDTTAIQSWWESISKARSHIISLSQLLALPDLASLADSDHPARSLLDSPFAYNSISQSLSSPTSGSGSDPLCQWLYDTCLSPDPSLRLLPLPFLPLISHLYLSRILDSESSPSLAGFEAVLLAVYSSETKARGGKSVTVSVPDLSQPSLYHSPVKSTGSLTGSTNSTKNSVGVLSPPLEPQIAVKSTKRACIVGVALEVYYKNISLLPAQSKVDFCDFVCSWAGQDCSCRFELDEDEHNEELSLVNENLEKLGIGDDGNGNCDVVSERKRGARVPLPWELMQPILRVLGHCLLGPMNSQEVKDVASKAVRCVYARASHDLVPQVILATRSLIQLDKSSRKAARLELVNSQQVTGGSNPNTPTKPKKPEVYLMSK